MMDALKADKKFSFIIPTYNAARHLERCLKSIISQDYAREETEIIGIDGGSSDDTVRILSKYNCRVLGNPGRLAEYGVQIGVKEARGELLVIFAADNELVGNDWVRKVAAVFDNHKEVSAVWGRLSSGADDPALNKYFELIQSDPLNWFLNKNLDRYKKAAQINGVNVFLFKVERDKPLVWGANGLVYKADKIKQIWDQEGYLGDNDAFQYMIEQGYNKVAYFNTAFVYHHHVARLSDWVKKWKRNFCDHLLSRHSTRNMRWVFIGSFKRRLFAWAIYSSIPVFSFAHSVYLSLESRNKFWLLHAWVSFAQFFTYFLLLIRVKNAPVFLMNTALSSPGE
jgi:glycosyltransferase involved in cell wall biosynthesis